MNFIDVTYVHIYFTESDKQLKTLLAKLHNCEKVRGVTVYRAITGFGKSGVVHSSSLVDLSLDLPLVLEFFDTPDTIERVLNDLEPDIENGHLVCWNARLNISTPT